MQKVGLYIGTQFPPGTNVAAALKDMSEQVRLARQSGFSSLWVPHHYLTQPMQMLAPVPMLSYLLRDAEGMTIGTNILIMPLLHPVHVAEDAVTLDLLSGGRYVLGIGVGYRDAEFQTFNVPLKERAQRMNESIEIMRRLWTEDKIKHNGKIFQIDDLGIGLKPQRKGGPPIWLAAVVDAAVKRAAQLGDAWLITNFAHLSVLVPQMAMYRKLLTEAGKEFPAEAPITRECYIGVDAGQGARRMQGGPSIQIRGLFVLGPRQAVEGGGVVRAAVRGFRQGSLHHRRQIVCQRRGGALPIAAWRKSFHHARAVAGSRTGQGPQDNICARRDFRLGLGVAGRGYGMPARGLSRLTEDHGCGIVTMHSIDGPPCRSVWLQQPR